jgi:hypothetical protein
LRYVNYGLLSRFYFHVPLPDVRASA